VSSQTEKVLGIGENYLHEEFQMAKLRLGGKDWFAIKRSQSGFDSCLIMCSYLLHNKANNDTNYMHSNLGKSSSHSLQALQTWKCQGFVLASLHSGAMRSIQFILITSDCHITY
jgi:hypothetical protein